MSLAESEAERPRKRSRGVTKKRRSQAEHGPDLFPHGGSADHRGFALGWALS